MEVNTSNATGFLNYTDESGSDELLDFRQLVYFGELGTETSFIITTEGKVIKTKTALQDLIDQYTDIAGMLDQFVAINCGPGILVQREEEKMLYQWPTKPASEELH